MFDNPDTCATLLPPDREAAVARLRRRESRISRVLVNAGTAIALAGLLAIPVYVVGALAAPFDWSGIDWTALGTRLGGSAKAGACAAIVAIALGVPTAMCTSHFCAPRLREWIKPLFELLDAIPTVVLGLVAAVSFAPWLQAHVATVLLLVVCAPCGLLAVGFASGSSRRDRWLVPALLPVVVAATALAVAIGDASNGSLVTPPTPWNALLVGLALGVGTMPLVFSLSDDALNGVPRGQERAALALGATRWQAFATIALPAAGSGLLAAALLGIARAFGETMIVLMASGNTPVGGFDPLTGLRSLSADIALGMPDAAPASTTYRDLLLAAGALLVVSFTFGFVADALRRRLKRRLAADFA